jgi:transposase InsO family protein
MPWKVPPVSEHRLALCHAVRTAGRSVTDAATDFGVSRKTAYKWLACFDAADSSPLLALVDRSRRPHRSPRQTDAQVEQSILQVRDQRHWGPRKIHAYLRQEAARQGQSPPQLPSIRTLSSILLRCGRVGEQTPAPNPPPQRFERDQPNELWQVDFKGPIQVDRHKLMPLSILDDCSRYLLAFEPCGDVKMASAWTVLWETFGQVGLPLQLLCDNGFSTMGTSRPAGISWFDAQLIRAGVRPSHGRAYHPQTQGKVERLHGSAMRELVGFDARRDNKEHFVEDCRRWRNVYNNIRPHEAVDDHPPATRWIPSPRKRPATLPEAMSFYPADATLRTIGSSGTISFRGCQILCGKGIAGQRVRIEERDTELAVFYCWKEFRTLSHDQLIKGKNL